MTPPPDFSPEAIAARWDRSHDHGPDDYTDDGCRVLAAAAFQDIAQLLAALEAERVAHAESERDADQLLRERDDAIDWADKLAYSIAPQSVIGEHSSMNNPWENALEARDAAEAALEAKDGEVKRLRRQRDEAYEHDRGVTDSSNWAMKHLGLLFDAARNLVEYLDIIDPDARTPGEKKLSADLASTLAALAPSTPGDEQ